MHDPRFLTTLGLIVIFAAFFSVLARRCKLPTIVAYLAAGVVAGPVAGVIEGSEAVDLIAEVGIILLLFLVGLEMTIDKIQSVGKVAVVTGVIQIVVTFVVGLGISAALGIGIVTSGLLAVGLTFSSTVVVVKMLVEKRETETVQGQTAIGVLLVQDVFAILLLTVFAGLGESGVSEGVAMGEIFWGVGKAIAGMVAIFIAILLAARFVLPRPFAWANRSRETVFVWSLAWCFLVVLAGHALHLSAEIGAFLAGVSLAQFPHSHDLQRRVRPLMNFFVAVFFVSLGVGMEFQTGLFFWVQAAVLSLFVVVGKFVIIAVITSKLGYSARRSFDAAVLLTQISEFSFIVTAEAADVGIGSGEEQPLLALIGLITITVSSIAILNRDALYRSLARTGFFRLLRLEEDGASASQDGGVLRGHTIVVGMNTLGRELATRLHSEGQKVVAIDTDPAKLEGLPCRRLTGNAASDSVLNDVNLASAKLLVSTLHIDDINDLLAFRAKVEGVAYAVHAANLKRVNILLEMGAEYLMTPKVDGIKTQNAQLAELGYIPEK